jgi:CRISPR-associated protein Cmr2
MSYLLAISIGPVQDFIAAARRTADLYAGSQLLMEVTKAIALHLKSSGANLIFPSDPEQGGANKILVEVSSDPRKLVETLKIVARDFLLSEWATAYSSFSHKSAVQEAQAKTQIQDFLEIYAAWVERGDYKESRQQVERLLAGRKALRDFKQSTDDSKLPKSPLDASRASVLLNPVLLADAKASDKPLRLKATEHLDAISLLKRIYGTRESDRVIDTRTMARLALDKKAKPQDRAFEDEDSVTEPQPYYAILHADGDKMGALIETKNSADEHRTFSSKLSSFASGVEAIVKKHHGFKIYSGGDDVLAFLPVNTAIACARELAEAFLKDASLSVGIAIVHYREPLSLSLDYARAAEKAAKNKGDKNPDNHGNRLAVALHTRGGAPMIVVEPWNKPELEKLLEFYQGQESVSRGVPYELKQLAREWLPELPAKALQAEVLRIVKRKQATKEAAKQPENTNWFDLPISDVADSKAAIKALETFANKLVLARFLSGLGGENAK